MADDYSLSNLKFVPKGELDEVFGMPIPIDLITDVIRNSEYYQRYLEMVARKPRQATTLTDEESGKKKKAPPSESGLTILLMKKMKKVKPNPKPQVKDDEYNLQRGIQMSLESFQAPIDGVAIREPVSGITR
ncbi:hypothetical protein Tco_1415365 [Tanacetum coccineum]